MENQKLCFGNRRPIYGSQFSRSDTRLANRFHFDTISKISFYNNNRLYEINVFA